LVADFFLDKVHAARCTFKKALKPDRKRQLIDEVCNVWKVSIRKACKVLRFERSLYTYKFKRGDQAALQQRIKEICETRIRFGYRRVHILLQREG
jgi:putative transposase